MTITWWFAFVGTFCTSSCLYLVTGLYLFVANDIIGSNPGVSWTPPCVWPRESVYCKFMVGHPKV